MARTLPVVLVMVVATLTGGALSAPSQATEPQDLRPNIVLVTTDDMRRDDLRWMPHTRALLGELRLTDFISNHPLCCPARAELLTGQYAQNSGVFHNVGPFGGYQALSEPDNTLASWLQDSGYQTGFVGKFLNHWNPYTGSPVPAGWTRFNPWVGSIYSPDRWTDFNDGDPIEPVEPGTHSNDGVTARTLDHIGSFSESDQPFFVWSSYVAPHPMTNDANEWGRVIPAARHVGRMAGVTPPYQKKPSFTYRGKRARALAKTWRARIESLMSVDEGVRDIHRALEAAGELDDTVVVFTSDNGVVLGEHRAKGKNLPWEEVLRVPLLARGPGVADGVSAKGAMFVDLAPSLAALAGVTPGRAVDGRADLFALDGGWPSTLIQAGSDNESEHFSWRGTRDSRWTYVDWIDGRVELYDRRRDPYQLRNLAGRRPAVQRRLAALTPTPY